MRPVAWGRVRPLGESRVVVPGGVAEAGAALTLCWYLSGVLALGQSLEVQAAFQMPGKLAHRTANKKKY